MIRRIMDPNLLKKLVNFRRRVRQFVRYIYALVQNRNCKNYKMKLFPLKTFVSPLLRLVTYVNVIKYRRFVRMNPLVSLKYCFIINILMVLIKNQVLLFVALVIIILRKITWKAVNILHLKQVNIYLLKNNRRSLRKFAMKHLLLKMVSSLLKNNLKVTRVLDLKQKDVLMVYLYKMENRI